MKKWIIRVWLILSICICVACIHNVEYTYMNDESTIESIQIVDLVDFKEDNYEFVQEEICEIENIDEFIEEFSKIDCQVHYGDPVQLETDVIVVKVIYENGDYELIDATAQIKRRQGVNHYGYRSFDREQFAKFLDLYLEDEVETENSSVQVEDEGLSLMQKVILGKNNFADGTNILEKEGVCEDDYENNGFIVVDLDRDGIDEEARKRFYKEFGIID